MRFSALSISYQVCWVRVAFRCRIVYRDVMFQRCGVAEANLPIQITLQVAAIPPTC